MSKEEQDEQVQEDMWKAKRWVEEQGVSFDTDYELPTGGQWRGDESLIWLNSHKTITAYVILHEYGHLLNGYGCCREHDEFKAHGSAVAIASILGIDLGDTFIENYVGWSECPIKGLPNDAVEGHYDSRSGANGSV